jgi:hypothetical protein
MSTDADPIVGNWYQYVDKGQKFEVIDVDEDTGAVEIQYADGDLDEIDIDEWYTTEIEPITAPDEWLETADDVPIEDNEGIEAEEQGVRGRRGARRRRDDVDPEADESDWEEARGDEPWEED